MKKILLVDDVKLLLEIQKKYLSASLVQILTACDGHEALEIARKELPDLIIMDNYMPRMDGITCCQLLKKTPDLAHIPVIMATNSTRGSDLQEYLSAGCVEVLSKPIDCKLFLNAIKKYIPDIDRRSARIPITIDLRILSRDSNYSVLTENLSFSGLFAAADMNVSVDDEIKLTFVLPERNVPIEIKGRVVWQRRNGASAGFGVEFVEVTGQGISMLRVSELKSFVTSQSQSRIALEQASS